MKNKNRYLHSINYDLFIPMCLVAICSFLLVVDGEVTHLDLGKALTSPWKSDSLFLGAEIEVLSGSKNVRVIRRSGTNQSLGRLYLVSEDGSDTHKFIFYNMRTDGNADPDTVDLGIYPANTRLTFMYDVISDSRPNGIERIGKKLYTGQNRLGEDRFISERSNNEGSRWAVGGSVDSTLVEVGFESFLCCFCRDIIFEITNAKIVH